MYIYTIKQPGRDLKNSYGDSTQQFANLLQTLNAEFYKANVALAYFINCKERQAEELRILQSGIETEANLERQRRIRQELEEKHYPFHDAEISEQIASDAKFTAKSEWWTQTRLDRMVEHKLTLIYARAFIYSLDMFGKILKLISETANTPSGVRDIYRNFRDVFPDLVGVRDTTQHLEDRSRGLDKSKKPLNLKPVNTGSIEASNGGLIIENLSGTKFGSTMSNGSYGEIDVSPVSMQQLQCLFQSLLDSFEWVGREVYYP